MGDVTAVRRSSEVPEEWRLDREGDINLSEVDLLAGEVLVVRCALGNQVGRDRCWGEWSRGRWASITWACSEAG